MGADTAITHAAANQSAVYYTGLTVPDLLSITPEVPNLFNRQVAGDNTSMVSNYSSWVPQVCSWCPNPKTFPSCHVIVHLAHAPCKASLR